MWIGLAGVVVAATLVAVALRAGLDAQRAAARAADAHLRGDRLGEIKELGRVIRALPVDRSPAEQASTTLVAVATRAEQEGDLSLAREAWRELRSGWFAVRGLTDPGRRWIERSSHELARLGVPREASIEPRLAAPMASLVAAFALFGWAGCGFGLIWQGLEPSGRLRTRSAAFWTLGLVAWLAIWVAALRAA
jgi:hypothetical protein